MAIMWPRELPNDVLRNILRSTECSVYKKLQASLDDSFTVFYSRPWLGLKPDGEEIDGECDFVIAHPALGILTLEVKGGVIAYDPRLDQWTSRDRWKITHRIKNPVGQARTSKHQLREKLQKYPGWTPRKVRMRHGVIFPHALKPNLDLAPDMPLCLFCFSDDFDNNLKAWVLARFGELDNKYNREQALGRDGIRALEDLLARPFQLHVPLGRVIDDDDKNIQILTTQQYYILRSIECISRAAIAGGAGTGKTVLAMEEARRCSSNGYRTLFTCFNKPLAAEIKRRMSSIKNLEVTAYHELCLRIISSAGINIPTGLSETIFYRDVCPNLVVDALCMHQFQGYDAIIIDEGQDFYASWWPAIECLMDQKGRGIFRVFYDSNQAVYGNILNIPADVRLIPIRLTLNMRNTLKIHEVLKRYYEGHPIEPLGPVGLMVEWIKCKTVQALIHQTEKCVKRLFINERINLEDITILMSDNTLLEATNWTHNITGYPTTNCSELKKNAVVIDTVRRFKGLESKIVILVLTQDMISKTELLYVATSRARNHLIILGLDKIVEKIFPPNSCDA